MSPREPIGMPRRGHEEPMGGQGVAKGSREDPFWEPGAATSEPNRFQKGVKESLWEAKVSP